MLQQVIKWPAALIIPRVFKANTQDAVCCFFAVRKRVRYSSAPKTQE